MSQLVAAGSGVEIDPSDPFANFATQQLDPARPLIASRQLRRRQMASRVIESGQTAAALFAVAVLAFLVYSVASRGASVLSLEFLTKGPPAIEEAGGGGVGPEIVGTATLVAFATLMAMPIGILAALYMTEFASSRSARALRLVLDLLFGVPSIVIALFAFSLLVVGKGYNGFAGAFALSIIMLPLVARTTQETLLLVPQGLRDAAAALGVSRWRALRGVVLPSALGGIITGTVLAVARAAGETAPLLLTNAFIGKTLDFSIFNQSIPNIPVYIYSASTAANPSGWARAWGAAFVLLMFILAVNIAARTIHARSRRKLTR
ncbi:MAG TPA: phosphate ABC transporter permease PstA [Solirubrobacteraceae bacterium]|jgi:phosphate transport system permease protein|nr:phosphate ABC transporter permease PstA [Solirubrobacteraceae bacterium]